MVSVRPQPTPAALVLALSGCSKSPAPKPSDLTVYFTCDTHGRLVPCGCFTGQYGGMTRLKTLLDAETTTNALRLDVGDAIGGSEDFDVIEYRYLLRAYAALKYDALNLGHREAQLSAAQLRELKRPAPPLLSANLLDKATGKPFFDSYRILERTGWKHRRHRRARPARVWTTFSARGWSWRDGVHAQPIAAGGARQGGPARAARLHRRSKR